MVLTDEIKALPLPEGYEWDDDGRYFGVKRSHDGWWCWFCCHNTNGMIFRPPPRYTVEFHEPKDNYAGDYHSQRHYCVVDSLFHAAQIMSAKVCFGLYE